MEKNRTNRKRMRNNYNIDKVETTVCEVTESGTDVMDNTEVEDVAGDGEIIELVVKEPSYKTKECKVLGYEPATKKLSIDFDGYGMVVKNAVLTDVKDTVMVRYRGEVGKGLILEV